MILSLLDNRAFMANLAEKGGMQSAAEQSMRGQKARQAGC